jgi:hypothetical protein
VKILELLFAENHGRRVLGSQAEVKRMSGETERENHGHDSPDLNESSFSAADGNGPDRGRYRDEVFSKRVPAGKRTYFFDVKTTRSGEDFFITITESKRLEEGRYEKHKIFLYKEDFGKFVSAIHDTMRFVCSECLPGYEFRGMPQIPPAAEQEDAARDYTDGEY